MDTPAKKSIILIFFGSPQSSKRSDIYQFLVDIFKEIYEKYPFLGKLMARFFFAPLSLKKTCARYQKIYTKEGFPLPLQAEAAKKALQAKLPEHIFLHVAMQHGSPSIETVCKKAFSDGSDEYVVIPMYPQKVENMFLNIKNRIKKIAPEQNIRYIDQFYLDSWYIQPLVTMILEVQDSYDAVLFSYHSLPIKGSEEYVDQCQKTTKALVFLTQVSKELSMNKMKYLAGCDEQSVNDCSSPIAHLAHPDTSFYSWTVPKPWAIGYQSAVREKGWLTPKTDQVMQNFLRNGVQKLLVIAPGFVTKCSETILDLHQDMRSKFIQAGGKELTVLSEEIANPLFIASFAQYLLNI